MPHTIGVMTAAPAVAAEDPAVITGQPQKLREDATPAEMQDAGRSE